MKPCGTPQRISEILLILTNRVLFSRYEEDQLLAVPLTQ